MPRWSMHVPMPGGGVAIVCGSGPRPDPPVCHWCSKPTKFCCDFPTSGRDCNMPVCENHVTKVGKKDYCPMHSKQQKLFQP